uniref:Uncharacterized protein n=1 Tax=Hyaloperonospora arabidopsidis (strain Emoy2) TaxID=559515 RepID=M4BKB4_HYAAE
MEAKLLDEQFTALCAKWKAALPEREVLLAACTAAKQKIVTGHVEQLNAQLKDELLQQQLYFSALQQKLTQAPLWSHSALCQELFDRLHGYLHLVGVDLEDHKKTLQARFEVAVRLAPDLVSTFTREFVPLTLPDLPFSRTSTAATTVPLPVNAGGRIDVENGCGTLVSNVFVCKAPADVCIPQTEVQVGPSTYYARVERKDGEMRGACANQAWTSKLVSDDLAVIVTDFVDEDDKEVVEAARRKGQEGQAGIEGVPIMSLISESSLRTETCMVLTIARVIDPVKHVPIVLLRRLRVHRYNLPPDSPVVHRELHKLLPYFNGDFHMTMLNDAYTTVKKGDQLPAACRACARSNTKDVKELEKDEETNGNKDQALSNAR